MEGKDERKTPSDEGGSDSAAAAEQIPFEEEIKKIISDMDIKFGDSSADEDGKIPPTVERSPVRRKRVETPLRVGSASIASSATTVVHQRVPPKVSLTHVKSERYDWPPAQGNRLPEAQRQEGAPVDYRVPEQSFYQPERDEITEPTISETVCTTTENTTTSYAQSSSQPVPRPSGGFMLPVPEDQSLINFQGVGGDEIHQQQYQRHQQQYQHHPCDVLPECNAPLPAYEYDYQPLGQHARYPPNYGQAECGHQYYPQGYQDHPPCNDQEPYGMKENINRYNHSHMSLSAVKQSEKPGRRGSLTDYIVSKSRSFFNRREESDSGEVIPQLYKACVKNGTCPPRFTFKAVTGIQPPYLGESVAPQYVPPTNQQNCPAMPTCDRVNGGTLYREHVNPCCCPQELPKNYGYNRSCGKNCEISTVPSGNGGIKTKAYYADLGCGYISQGSVPEKVDIYCFDQLNTGFFRTSDHPPPLFADIAVQRTEKYATVFWAEIYGVVNVGTAFFIALLLQTFKFLLQGIVRPLMIGSVQLLSDYFIKPLLTLLYNGFTQPISIFFYNVIASVRDVMQPLAKGLGYFFELIAVVLRAIRIVEVRNVTNITPCTPQAVKYC